MHIRPEFQDVDRHITLVFAAQRIETPMLA